MTHAVVRGREPRSQTCAHDPRPLHEGPPPVERKDSAAGDRLAFECEVKLAGDEADAGQVEGYGSVFNLLDRVGDVVMPGAFKATLADWKRRKALPPMLWQHNTDMPIGVWDEVVEDDRGLRIKGRLVLDVPQAAQARALVKAGAVKGLSIGYRTKEVEVDRTTGVRRLKKVDLWEISLVTFPALPEAQVTGVKGDFDPRALERELRSSLNLSSDDAVKAVAVMKKHLRDGGAVDGPGDRDGQRELLMSLRKAQEAFR